MIIICCRCKSDLGRKVPLDDESITHGLCSACVAKYQAEAVAWHAATARGRIICPWCQNEHSDGIVKPGITTCKLCKTCDKLLKEGAVEHKATLHEAQLMFRAVYRVAR